MSNKQFSKLAAEMNLSPDSATVLAVLARHPKPEDPRVIALAKRLDGVARRVAENLISGGASNADDEPAVEMANLYREWGRASTR